jgi:cyclohexa-1,5-dienecarbonyl-CoA hydratase
MPEACAGMLSSFHGMFRTMLDASVVTLAAVRGQCLGGGLELAAFCQRVFASEDARLGQPEIVLGVFAPVASFVLSERMGRGGADDLLLSGRSITAQEALRLGLVDELHADPGAAAMAYAHTHLLPRSASSLRRAVRAARLGFSERFRGQIAQLETMYLDDLMRTADANEGLQAFLEKRQPEWKNR